MKKTSCELAVGRRPLLLVLSGPSGAGKDAVISAMKGCPFQRIVTMTTRAPRPGERDGIDYHFVTRGKFEEMRQSGGLLESAIVYGNYYGVPREPVRLALEQSRDVLLKVDVQGAATIRKAMPQAILIYIVTPSMQELVTRLKGRSTETPADLELRLREAGQEIKQMALFDYLVVNRPDAVQEAVSEIKAIITAEKCRITPPGSSTPA